MKQYEIIIQFSNGAHSRQWTGTDVAADNDCSCYIFKEDEIQEQERKAKEELKDNPWAKVEVFEIEE